MVGREGGSECEDHVESGACNSPLPYVCFYMLALGKGTMQGEQGPARPVFPISVCLSQWLPTPHGSHCNMHSCQQALRSCYCRGAPQSPRHCRRQGATTSTVYFTT
jgi:hypothetical protein